MEFNQKDLDHLDLSFLDWVLMHEDKIPPALMVAFLIGRATSISFYFAPSDIEAKKLLVDQLKQCIQIQKQKKEATNE